MKKFISIFLAMLLCFSVVGCGQKAATTNQDTKDKVDTSSKEDKEVSKKDEVIVMKFGHAHPADSPRNKSVLYFKELVEEKSNGRVKVEVFPAGQLGKEPEMIESVKMGTLEACRAGCFDLTCKELLVYTMPFLFDSVEDFQEIARGPIGEQIAKHAEGSGLRILATGDAGGFRHWTNNVRPITKPEDMQGLKMRTPPIDSIVKTMEALGANPVSVPYVETYMGLKTGVADGQENPIINIGTMKFYEVQKYMTEVNYQVHPDPIYVSEEWLNTLPEDIKTLITECAKEMMVYSDGLIADAEASFGDAINNSMEITKLSKEQRQAFIEQCKPVYDYFLDNDLIAKEDLDAIYKALENK